MLTPDRLRSAFESGLPFDAYVATGTPAQQENWTRFLNSVTLTEAQVTLLRGFTRRMNIIVSSGVWCGDCVQQCPMLRRIEEANPDRITLRFLDRDRHKSFSEPLMICGGLRVPTAVFVNEDFEFVGVLGDRTLSRYRAIAARQLGPSCPLPGAPIPADEIAATLQDWVNEAERVQLLLRLSPKLRERYGD